MNHERLPVDRNTKRLLVTQARALRKRATPAERLLWQRLRGGQLGGLRVRRQQPIGAFVVDFFVPAVKLVIEIDGSIHDGEPTQARDAERQRQLESIGLRVVRFRNEEVLSDVEHVITTLRRKALTPGPSP